MPSNIFCSYPSSNFSSNIFYSSSSSSSFPSSRPHVLSTGPGSVPLLLDHSTWWWWWWRLWWWLRGYWWWWWEEPCRMRRCQWCQESLRPAAAIVSWGHGGEDHDDNDCDGDDAYLRHGTVINTWGTASRRKRWQRWAIAWTWKWRKQTRIVLWRRRQVWRWSGGFSSK